MQPILWLELIHLPRPDKAKQKTKAGCCGSCGLKLSHTGSPPATGQLHPESMPGHPLWLWGFLAQHLPHNPRRALGLERVRKRRGNREF